MKDEGELKRERAEVLKIEQEGIWWRILSKL
jgi:hypothetical protein